MASDLKFVKFVADQIDDACGVSYRAMFGEYVLYSNGKVVALVCDNQLFVKPTVSRTEATVNAVGGLRVVPHHGFAGMPEIDILVVPGGSGVRPLLEDPPMLDWIREVASEAALVTSVCTGALLLARAGLLKNKRATTHWAALDTLAEMDPTITVEREARVVEDGETWQPIFTGAYTRQNNGH